MVFDKLFIIYIIFYVGFVVSVIRIVSLEFEEVY